MRKPIPSLLLLAVAGLLALACSSCSPAAKKARHLADANRYYDAGEYDQAEIEYLNVLKLEQLNPQAIGRLGLIYADQGRTGRAIAFIKMGNELQPEDLDLRLKLGQLNLATGNLPEAQNQANYVLDRRPQDPEAPLLLASALASPAEVEAMRSRLQALPPPAPAGAPVLAALGMIEFRQRHFKEAEALYRQALAADPKFAAADSALAVLHLARQNLAAAETAMKQAAELSPFRSQRRLHYAQFKLRTGNPAAGRQVLEEMTKKVPDYMPAWLALAEIALSEKKFEECAPFLARVFARDPENLEARLLHGRLLFARGDYAKAITEFEKLADTYPRLPGAHFELGRTYAASGEPGKAIASLNQAVNLAPGMAEAVLLLAELNLQKGDFSAVIVALKPRLQQHPEMVPGWLLLAMAYRGQGNFNDALAIYSQLETQLLKAPQLPLLRGQVLQQQRKTAEARQAYARALELTPESPVALEQLVDLDLLEKKYQPARERVEAHLAGHPALAGYSQLLFAKIFLAQNDPVQAEPALKKAIELMPDFQNSYFLLARLYAGTNQQQKALASLQQSVAHNPKDIRALMLIGVINDQLKNYPAAQDGYEKVLALNPRNPGALNNLAYLYSERSGQPAKALELAQKARELVPGDPNIADTLGWILHRQRQYPRALILLLESAGKLPDSAEIQYHLGMTHYMLGQEEPARRALEHALELDKNLPGKDEAQSRLAILAADGGTAGAKATLENALARQPDDPVALVHLAAVHERAGNPNDAIKSYQAALQASPTNVKAALGLTQLYLARHDTPKALEQAKNTRKLAPDDPDVAQILGQLAYQIGEHQWAASLLQEAIQKKTDSPDLYLDLALALYSVGRVADAETAGRNALQPGGIFLRADVARRLLGMIALAADPAEAVKQAAQVELVLKSDPEYVPALMAFGTIKEKQLEAGDAWQAYEKALARFPDFSPAKRRLAILGASRAGFDQKTYDWALQARTAYPADHELAKALGILTYRKGDYARALALLKESLAPRGDDAELWFYLGLAQSQLGKAVDSKASLQRALDLNLRSDLATEARKTLSGVK